MVEEKPAPASTPNPEASYEFELVMGPRQMASVAFVCIVATAVFSSFAYLAGKATASRPATVLAAAPAPRPAPPPALVVAAAKPVVPATQPVESPALPISTEPYYSDPVPGKLYLQIAAVEKPMAVVFVEGLRTHKLPVIYGPGPGSDGRIFRVLVGPVQDGSEYNAVKEELRKIGIEPLPRRY